MVSALARLQSIPKCDVFTVNTYRDLLPQFIYRGIHVHVSSPKSKVSAESKLFLEHDNFLLRKLVATCNCEHRPDLIVVVSVVGTVLLVRAEDTCGTRFK